MDHKDNSQVKRFWEGRARSQEASQEEVTHRDVWQRGLEIDMIKQHVSGYCRVLDVGCGNGYTTKSIAPVVEEIVGIDYSEEMIRRAREEAVPEGCVESGNVSFNVCNVLTLDRSSFGEFDAVISERCLINLSSWEEQKLALVNIASVIKSGGRFVFVEGSRNGRQRLNELRVQAGLEPMPPVWHNVDFEENATTDYLSQFFKVEKRLHFGVYDFVSRVVHPLLVAPEEPKYKAKINQVGARLALKVQDMGFISRVLFLILKRR